jgi:cation/acetate symporter
MSILAWTWIIVGLSFSLYIYIAWRSRVSDVKGFYVAGSAVPAVYNGMATAADWMSAASFISMAGMISFMGYAGSMYLMGWTGGYVLLALLLAPYLRKFGKFTVPDFVGERYYSNVARTVALICAIFVSLTYVAGQMRGVGIVFSRYLELPIDWGVVVGMCIVFCYAGLGGMKGITWTQVAQYTVLIVAYMIPAVVVSMKLTGVPIPQLGYGAALTEGPNAGKWLLETIDLIQKDLGFNAYTSAWGPGSKSMLDVLFITVSLMVGTAGLPHIIIRFYTTPTVKAARASAGWALLFIALLYTTAPSVAAFARYNMINSLENVAYKAAPQWFLDWEKTGLVAWVDKNNDGKIQYSPGPAFVGPPKFTGQAGPEGNRLVSNTITTNKNELFVDNDIIVLASPQIANLPAWVVALVAAGGLAAALSTAAGLLLVIGSAISHDLYFRMINPNANEKTRMLLSRIMIGVAICVAGYFGINPPAFVAQVVAFAFGLASASFFPIIIMGIFWKRATKEGCICGMAAGMAFTAFYILQVNFWKVPPWLFGISAEGIGTVGMLINFFVIWIVSLVTKPPPQEVQDMVERIRYPKGAGAASDH